MIYVKKSICMNEEALMLIAPDYHEDLSKAGFSKFVTTNLMDSLRKKIHPKSFLKITPKHYLKENFMKEDYYTKFSKEAADVSIFDEIKELFVKLSKNQDKKTRSKIEHTSIAKIRNMIEKMLENKESFGF